MTTQRKTVLCVLVAVSLVAAGAATAEDSGAAMTPEMMQAWMESISPGEHHRSYADFVGKWKANITMWQAPGAPPQKSEGTSEYKMIFGGRHLVQNLDTLMMGMPFKGMGMAGYDNQKKQHTMVWVDNMSTSTTFSTGECSADHKTETHRTTIKDPMTGQDRKVRFVTRVVSKDRHVFEYYMTMPDNNEFKMMEITYDRI